MKLYNNPPKNTWTELLKRPVADTSYLEETVGRILEDVKKKWGRCLKKIHGAIRQSKAGQLCRV